MFSFIFVMISSLSILSFERYLAICHPTLVSEYTLSSKSSSKSRVFMIILAIWMVGFILVGIYFFYGMGNMKIWDELMLSIIFYIPMLIMVSMYTLIILKLKRLATKSNKETAGPLKQGAPKMLSKSANQYSVFFGFSFLVYCIPRLEN